MTRSRLLISLMVIALAAALIGGATMAWFTDSDEAGEVTMTAGILKIDVSKGLTEFNDLFPESSKHGNMNPGDVYDEIEILIENNGTKNLAWFGDWTAEAIGVEGIDEIDDCLLDAIYVHSAKMEFLSPGGEGIWENEDHFIDEGVGAGNDKNYWDGLVDDDFGVISLRKFIDNDGMGTVPYEHMGALKPGYSYKLTVKFGFSEKADNDYQGDVASPIDVGFEVLSTQVVAKAINDEIKDGLGIHETWLKAQLEKQGAE